MAMSGVNRLINSENTVNGNDLDTLKEKLSGDANAEAEKIEKDGVKYKEVKK